MHRIPNETDDRGVRAIERSPRVLITGATGILGGACLVHLLRTRTGCTCVALVRARSPEEATNRLHRSLLRFEEPGHAPASEWLHRVEALPGDIVERTSLDDSRLDEVTHVVHAAADTSFRSVRNVRRVNILGTLTLAHRMRRSATLQRFLHVGTAFSCGLVEAAQQPILEDDYPRHDAKHLVEYTRAKAEAEALLENTAPELPLVIARPSVIAGHTRLGCTVSSSIFWFYRAVDLLRRVTWPLETREDVIPVDYAAHALVELLLSSTLQHRRYHISAGLDGSCTWHELATAFARHHGVRRDDPYRIVDWETIVRERSRLASRLGPGDEDRLLEALALYYRFPGLVFDNTRLIAAGLRPPPRFVDYLDRCMTQPPARSVYEQMRDDD